MPTLDITQILSQLVSFHTTADHPDEVGRCFDYVQQIVSPYPLNIKRHVSNNIESMVISTRKTSQPLVLLQAHIDVVPGYAHQFTMQSRGGKLLGRGVYDMKFAAASFIALVQQLGDTLPAYDFALMLTADEENGGHNGVRYLLEQGYGASVCILPDSGENFALEANAKGFATLELTVKGSSGHGSRPWEADNAALKLVNIVDLITKACAHSSHMDTTVTPTLLSAGSAYNQIPGEASVTFDIRFPSMAEYEHTSSKIEELCKLHGASAAFTFRGPALHHPTDGQYVKIWQAGTEKFLGKKPGFTSSMGASDARYFAEHNIPTILTRPVGGGHHGGSEWINKQSLVTFHNILKYFIAHAARC